VKSVAVIQARMGSSRLPGKVMMDLAGQPVLAHVVARAKAAPGVDQVCCAIPDTRADDPLAELAEGLGAVVVRGSEADVLSRYAKAAEATDAERLLRITADCPFLDPEVAGQVLALLDGGADYGSNVAPRSWPKGLDVESFTAEALRKAAWAASDPYDREHVTPWMRANLVCANLALPSDARAGWRWTLDHPEDLEFCRAVAARLPPWPHLAAYAEVAAVVEAEPALAKINAHCV
jgi:spore coat polysaccharide biosynthesis protein SpsF (cytidylyltransferase family)